MDIIYACFLLCSFIGTLNAIVLNSSVSENETCNGDVLGKEWKYMASLQLAAKHTPDSNRKTWKHFCGSGLISYRFLLTAAFCIFYMEPRKGPNFVFSSAVVGSVDVSGDIKNRFSISNAGVIPQYHATKSAKAKANYEIGLVLLKFAVEDLMGSPLIISHNPIHKGHAASISGWGCDHLEDANVSFEDSCVSNTLNTLKVHLVDKVECQSTYPSANHNTPQFCAKGTDNEMTSWRDMGSPLVQLAMYQQKVANSVIGVAVSVTGNGKPFHIRFIRLMHLKPSLDELMNQLIEDAFGSGR